MLGLPKHKFELSAFDLVDTGLTLVGSSVGSLDDTREIVDFALTNPSVLPDVTIVEFQKDAVQKAFDMLREGTGEGRYVVAM
jgi:D-arabinose 1-dehydrogenase-like Zn-dependent alcohol dehydrogenase